MTETTVKENAKCKKSSNPNPAGNLGHNEKTKPKYNRIEERKDFQIKGPVNIFN